MKKILVTGAGGFIGGHIVKELLKRGYNVRASDIKNFDENKYTSIGVRTVYTLNSLEIIMKHPLLGVGTGDFPSEYKKINSKNTPNIPNAENPHNMYILILMQLGLVGLISFLSIFYYQVELSRKSSSRFIRDFGIAMPILFSVILLSDSYLLGHYTTLVYAIFSSFLYKNFEKN